MHAEIRAAGAEVLLEDVGQSFGAAAVLAGVGLRIAPGEALALLGPSGCGKTTLLRLVAGLGRPTAGRISLGGRIVADAADGRFVPPERRSLGMVFQDYALWPHMTVAGNVAFPLEMRGAARTERAAAVEAALRLVGLDGMGGRQPSTLSGGQQQRVALARAVVSRPSVLLFDEPLSNLDRDLRETLSAEIAALVRRLGATAVYVTHDHAEAFAVADRVAVMGGGSLLQVAAPEDLVAAPASPEVAAFLKLGLVLPGDAADGVIALDGGRMRVAPPPSFARGGGPGHLFAPRAALRLSDPDGAAVAGVALRTRFVGDGYAVRLRVAGSEQVEIASVRRVPDGERIGVEVDWDKARWFPAAGARAPAGADARAATPTRQGGREA